MSPAGTSFTRTASDCATNPSASRGEVLAAGPSLTYSTKGGTMLIAQWQHEFERENRFGGDKALFKLVMPF